jgi:hypothetical protein
MITHIGSGCSSSSCSGTKCSTIWEKTRIASEANAKRSEVKRTRTRYNLKETGKSASQRVAVLNDHFSLQHVSFGIFAEYAGICFRIVIFHPQVVVLPRCYDMIVPRWYGYSHNTPVTLYEHLLQTKIVGYPADQDNACGSDETSFPVLSLYPKSIQTATDSCQNNKPVKISYHDRFP